MSEPAGGVTLDALLRALNTAFVEPLVTPSGGEVLIGSVILVDADDLLHLELAVAAAGDLWLLAGVSAADAVSWLESLTSVDPALRPRAVLSKAAAGSRLMQRAAAEVGVALIAVHAQTRWDALLTTTRAVLDHSVRRLDASPLVGRTFGADTDLFGLAQTVAKLTNGMVSIEDDRSNVLAYSASDEAADELRRLSILGRQGPADYLKQLRRWGVFDRLRRSDEVIEVPADSALGMRRRLVVSIRQTAAEQAASDLTLGAIWVQEGAEPLAADSGAVLRGASAVAARLITRVLNAPTNEALQIQRLLGARGGGVDVPSLASALSIPTTGPAVVIGFGLVDRARTDALPELAAALRLHASAFARESLVTTIGERIYVLLPRVQSTKVLASWTGGIITRLAATGAAGLRAAIATPVAQLVDVAAARSEVDRVLEGTSVNQRVATLADSRTPVLLGEIVDLVAAHPKLADPRIEALLAYDVRHGTVLRASLEEYLRLFGDVRRAAEQLEIHPNTLRYRISRAAQVLDIDLGDPAGRLLLEIQLAMLSRAAR